MIQKSKRSIGEIEQDFKAGDFIVHEGDESGEPIEFREMATSLTRRGFDSVIFGHSHHAGYIDLGDGKQYFNTGSWLVRPDYLEIDNGKISLKTWNPQN